MIMKEQIKDNILIEITSDALYGYMTIFDNENEEKNREFTYDEVIKEIKKIIKYGLKENIVKIAIENNIYNEKICIAEGVAPIDGKDGYIKYYFDNEKKLSPKVKSDGTVDYKELGIVNNVFKGDVLAEIVLPKEGTVGYRVTGEEIPYKKGKIPLLRQGKNTMLTEDNLRIIATRDGLVKLNGRKISVLDVFSIPGVDNSTGNVYFNGTVVVNGNVVNEFQLKADEDIEIRGVVEGALVESGGDILIRRGVQGYNKGKIISNNKVTTKFIENGYVKANGEIISEAIMHSQVFSNENIKVIGKRGLIVGGICRARGEIHAKTVGSSMATATVLEVGLDPSMKQKYEELKRDMELAKENLGKVEKSISMLEVMIETGKIDEQKKQLYDKLITTRESIGAELRKINKKFIIIKSQIEDTTRGQIKVEGSVYPGVKIVIGDSVMFIRDELSHCTFYRKEAEIEIGPY